MVGGTGIRKGRKVRRRKGESYRRPLKQICSIKKEEHNSEDTEECLLLRNKKATFEYSWASLTRCKKMWSLVERVGGYERKMYLVHISLEFTENGNCFGTKRIYIVTPKFLKHRMWRTNLKVLSEWRRQKQRWEKRVNRIELEAVEARLHPSTGIILEEETGMIWIKKHNQRHTWRKLFQNWLVMSSHCGTVERIWLVSIRIQVQSPASLSRLRIQCCCGCG